MDEFSTARTPRKIDVPLLRKVLEHITAHPEEHQQGWWGEKTSCGTAYCVAGHVAVMTGHEIQWELDCDDVSAYRASRTQDGRQIMDVAREALGLTLVQAQDLFAGDNSRSNLWHLASQMTNGEIEVPPSMLRTETPKVRAF